MFSFGLLLGQHFVAPAFAQQNDRPPRPNCDPNYAWVCVPIAGDVDCVGGQGNGPAYAAGPIKVIGDEIYELDREKDGYACEPKGWTPPKN